MTLFVLGAGGYIGRKVVADLSSRRPVQVVSSTLKGVGVLPLDLQRPDDFDYGRVGSDDLVLFGAGISSPDICASEHDIAYAVNVTGTARVIERLIARKAKVIFLSSDVVFGERVEETYEDDELRPLGPYAEMKAEIERRFDGEAEVKVFRLSLVLSGDDKFLLYLRSCAAKGAPVQVIDGLERRVVAARDVVALVEVLGRDWGALPSRHLNVAGPELASRRDIVDTFIKVTGTPIRIEPLVPPTDFFTARPHVINMGSRYLEMVLGRAPTTIRASIADAFAGGTIT